MFYLLAFFSSLTHYESHIGIVLFRTSKPVGSSASISVQYTFRIFLIVQMFSRTKKEVGLRTQGCGNRFVLIDA